MSPKKLLVLTAVVAVLFGFIFFFERKMPTTEERTRKGDLYWDIPEERIEKIELARAGETLEFQRSGAAGWKMLKPDKYPADGLAVGGVVAELAELRRAGGENTGEAKPADFGLEKPTAKATIVWTDPNDPKNRKTRTIEFGIEIPGTDVVAARVEGTQKVLFVPASVLASLKKGVDDFESHEVFGPVADATRIEILRGRGRLVLSRKDGAWWIVEPMADLADATEIDRLVGQLAGLRTKEFLHGGQDLATLGLNPPLFHVAISEGKGAVAAVDFGATRADGNTLYALREGQVLTVDRDIVDDLSREAEAFRSRTLLGFSRSDATAVEAAFEKSKYALSQKDGGWVAEGRPILAAAADDVMSALLDLKTRSFLDEAEAKGLPPAVATVTIHVKVGPAWTVSFHPRNAELIARVSARPGGFPLDSLTLGKLDAAFRKAVTTPTPGKKP